MSLPGQDLPGQTCHSIRKTTGGAYFLAATPRCVEGMMYTFALGVEASGIIPHVELAMSNHRHGMFTCMTGGRSLFHAKHHGVFASQYNGIIDRSGPLWDHDRTTCPVILTGASEEYSFLFGESEEDAMRWQSRWERKGLSDVDRTVMYVLLNPVTANLVQHAHSFPGFKIMPEDWGTWQVVVRPPWMADGYPPVVAYLALPPLHLCDRVPLVDTGDCRTVASPETLAAFAARREVVKRELVANLPPGRAVGRKYDPAAFELFISEERLQEAIAYYSNLLAEYEEEHRVERAARGQRVLGRRALRKQDPFYCPAPPPRRRCASRRPNFIGPTEAVGRAQKALAEFRRNYWRALANFNEHRDFDVLFPAGTVRMVSIASVRCRDGPLPEENPML